MARPSLAPARVRAENGIDDRTVASPPGSSHADPGRADSTRAALLDAAIHEFAANGFDGASTRDIARRAGVHQPQINYHFSSKLELWRAAVDHLFAELAGDAATAAASATDDLGRMEQMLRALVRHAARRPELNRMMVKESSIEGERLTWLVDRHVRTAFERQAGLWERLRAEGLVLDVDPLHAFYLVIGAATLIYTNAPEARLLTGVDPTEAAQVEAHADALVALFLRPAPVRSLP